MENQTKNISWIVGGIIVAAVVVYFVATGGSLPTSTQKIEGVKTEQGTVVVPGTSAVTDQGKVLNRSGQEADLKAEPGSPTAPDQSGPISEKSIPNSAVSLEATNYAFTPAEFKVKAGSVVTLALTAKADSTYIFKFNDPSLNAVAIGVGPFETRAITFKAPETKGEYSFFSDVPGQASRGMVGKMIVE